MPFLMRDVLTPGTSLAGGRYRLDYPLGRGGFGITYRAVHTEFEDHVAIKEFFPQEHAMRDGATGRLTVPTTQEGNYKRALERFMHEGRILFKLNHKNVVRVFDSFRERGTAYLVMQLLDGCTLRDKLNNSIVKRLPPADVKFITEQLVAALEAIHSKEIYHLDISPDNVQLTSSGEIVLIDFGAARHGLTSGTTRAFKLAYAAPEVLANRNVGPQSDLFELAMMISELLTGSVPPSVLERSSGETCDLSKVDEPWKSLLLSALHLEKSARPASVRDWWKEYREPRVNIILPPPKPKEDTPPPKRLRPNLRIGSKRRAPGRAVAESLTAPPSRNKSFEMAMKIVGCVIISCLLGLGAYFLTFGLLKPQLTSPSGAYTTNSAYSEEYKNADFMGIAAFCVVALGSFFGSARWVFKNNKQAG